MIKYIVSFSIVIVVFIIFFLPDYLISNFQGTGNNALYLLSIITMFWRER
jgi:hypothetical protein